MPVHGLSMHESAIDLISLLILHASPMAFLAIVQSVCRLVHMRHNPQLDSCHHVQLSGQCPFTCGSNAFGARMTKCAPAVQTQEAELKAARETVAQASAEVLRLEKDLHEACRQLAVLAEDDQDLRDKVSVCSI